MPRRVVVTGLGLITPVGATTSAAWENLLAGKSGAGPIRRFDASAFDVRFACEAWDFDPQAYLDRKEIKRSDRFVHLALGATAQALEHAGLGDALPDPERTGVIIGSGIGGIATFEEQCRLSIEKGFSRVSPFFVPMFIPDMAAGMISMRYGAKGPNYCTVSACASSAHALGEAFRVVQHGAADMMIVGGAEAAVTPLAIAGFANMKALSTRNDEPQKASRPFDRNRDGFVMGEGAGVLILESLEHALHRGAPILAEMAGYGMSADAYHMTQPAPGGEGAKRAMVACLADAGLQPADVDYINSHGTSTPHGDTAEVDAVKRLFGDHAGRLVLSSTKSMTGHLLGAAGGLEFSVCVLALRDGVIPPTINLDDPDDGFDLDFAANVKTARNVRVALSNSFGFGGHNVSLAVRTYAE